MAKSIKNTLHDGDLSTTTTYQAGIVQAAMHRKLQKFCDDILLPYGITKGQWLIIGAVFDNRATGIRISDLAEIVGTNVPFMTNTVNRLVDKKILMRVQNQLDSRSTLICLTPSFQPKCKTIEETLRNALRKEIYKDIPVDEFKIYMKVLYKLAGL